MEHSKKYQMPNKLLQALWNVAGPSVESMTILLNLIKDKLEGDQAGIDPDFTKGKTQKYASRTSILA